MNSQELKEQINTTTDVIYSLQRKLTELKKLCKHEEIKKQKCGDTYTATCCICGKHNWYCPDSPDNFCHYDNDTYNNDICDYCGEPNERT